MGRLSGKVAVVTGAGSGIGAASARAMAREGAHLVVTDRNGDTAAAVAQGIVDSGGEAVSVAVDVTSEDDVNAMLNTAISRFGRLDVLHNNAGATQSDVDHDITNTPDSAWRFAFEVDLLGVARGIRLAIPHLVETGGGSIINTASAGPLAGNTSLIAYAAAKAGVISLTKYVATSHGGQGIRCNAIAPGLVLTPGAQAVFPLPGLLSAIERHQPLDGFVTPDDVADLVVFLASDESRFITGQTHVIDAGSTTMGSAVPDIDDALRDARRKP